MTNINQIPQDILPSIFSYLPITVSKNRLPLMTVCKLWRNTFLSEKYDSFLFPPIAKAISEPFYQEEPDINNCKLWRSLCQPGGVYRVVKSIPKFRELGSHESRDNVGCSFLKEWQPPVLLKQTGVKDSPTKLLINTKTGEEVSIFSSEHLRYSATSKYLIIDDQTFMRFYEKGQLKFTRPISTFHLLSNDTELAVHNKKTKQLEIRNIESWNIRCTLNLTDYEIDYMAILTNRYLIGDGINYFNNSEDSKLILYDLEDNGKPLYIPIPDQEYQAIACNDHYLVTILKKPDSRDIFKPCDKKRKLCVWDLKKPGFPKIIEKEITADGEIFQYSYSRIEQNYFFALISRNPFWMGSPIFYSLVCNLVTGKCHFLRIHEKVIHIRPELPNIFVRSWGAKGELRERVISFPPKQVETPIPKSLIEEEPLPPVLKIVVDKPTKLEPEKPKEIQIPKSLIKEKPLLPVLEIVVDPPTKIEPEKTKKTQTEEKPVIQSPTTPRVHAVSRLFFDDIEAIRLVLGFAWKHRKVLILTALVVGTLAVGNHFAKLNST